MYSLAVAQLGKDKGNYCTSHSENLTCSSLSNHQLCMRYVLAYVKSVYVLLVPLFSDITDISITYHSIEPISSADPYFMSRSMKTAL